MIKANPTKLRRFNDRASHGCSSTFTSPRSSVNTPEPDPSRCQSPVPAFSLAPRSSGRQMEILNARSGKVTEDQDYIIFYYHKS
jgi:hypothetical protein